MGNRAVIAIKHAGDNALGIYLHWNGGRNSIEAFLDATKMVMGGRLGDEQYGTARLIQVITTFIGGNLSVGVDLVKNLDTDNFDNGTYVVNPATMEITERLYFDGEEPRGHDHGAFVRTILDKIKASAEAGAA